MSTVAEHRIQTQIIANLKRDFPFAYFWRQNVGMSRSANGGVVKFGEPGQADIMGVICGRFIAIEVKTENGRQSDAQRKFQDKIEIAGGYYVLARCLGDAMETARHIADVAAR